MGRILVVDDHDSLRKGLVKALTNAGHQVTTAQEVGLTSHPDETVFEHAQRLGPIVMTLDLDFSDLRNFPAITSGLSY